METTILPELRKSQISGTVSHEGEPVEGVIVFLESVDRFGQIFTSVTSVEGDFNFDKPNFGNFTLWTCKDGWNAVSMKVTISDQGESDSLILELSLGQ
jgi:hypothetical protein